MSIDGGNTLEKILAVSMLAITVVLMVFCILASWLKSERKELL